MKKIVTLILGLTLLFSLVACGEKQEELTEDHRMYLITDKGTIDDKSFNQGSFEGMKKYADEIKVTANYLRPEDETTEDYLASIEEAIAKGAEVVVTPGFLFEQAVYIAQERYPEVKFILIDGTPKHPDTGEELIAENTVAIMYREEQSGFLAGYAAVKEGFETLGFMGGMAVPAVVNFGYGYIAGADYAAKELGKEVTVRYTYLGDFLANPRFQTQAVSWYNDGVDVIFHAAGGAGGSVMSAAEEVDAKVIGVDVNQNDESDTVITSAMKNLQGSVYNAVKAAIEGGFEGGKLLTLGVEADGVQLPNDFSKFETFTEADYNAIYETLQNDVDGVTSGIPTLFTHGDLVSALSFDNVTIEAIGE